MQGQAKLKLQCVKLKRKAERTPEVEALKQRLSRLELKSPMEAHER